VPTNGESARSQTREGARTTCQIEEPVADLAEKVVVMLHAGQLVPRWLSRNIHGNDPLALEQELQVAVYGGQAEAGHRVLCDLEDLRRGEGTTCLFEGIEDGSTLLGHSDHAGEDKAHWFQLQTLLQLR